ncbi:SNF2 family N-terminal domain-containing protein [Hyaloscypha sp. PMI_1271]|nr:SNF2 family N-terminal domain-containing protein [Hyaloscypha sp. PMI_1271]
MAKATPNNTKSIDLLGGHDIIITTFQTVSSIWRKQTKEHGDPNLLFSINWHRIILDEAHTIQNPKSCLAQSCCALRSLNRWTITGTPIQNKLTDLASLVKFLQIYPYSEQESFDADILRPWRRGDADGFLRLKTLVRAITISRTKRVVRLPPREDFIHHLDFAPEELDLYENQKKHTVPLVRNALSSCPGHQSLNALQHLNALHLICSHGRLAQMYQGPETPMSHDKIDIQDSLFTQVLDGNSTCNNCGKELLEDLLEGPPSASMWQTGFGQWPGGDLLEAPFTPSTRSPTPSADQESPFSHRLNSMPTKVKALLADLAEHAPSEKSVVFSYWTYTLDLVQEMLDPHGIAYMRIDGKTSLPQRSQAMGLFQQDDRVRVMLVSITCGGAGLDLTAASRAYLLEPHWNPMIQEQALCRVHRQIVEIQKRKRYLAKVTFGRDPVTETNVDVGILQYLKSVLE